MINVWSLVYLFSPLVSNTMLGRELKTKKMPPLAPSTLTFLWSNKTIFMKIKLLGNGEERRTAVALLLLGEPLPSREKEREDEGGLEKGRG